MGYGHNTLLYPCVERPWCSIVQLIFANTKVKTEKENIQIREEWLMVQDSWGEWWGQLYAPLEWKDKEDKGGEEPIGLLGGRVQMWGDHVSDGGRGSLQ